MCHTTLNVGLGNDKTAFLQTTTQTHFIYMDLWNLIVSTIFVSKPPAKPHKQRLCGLFFFFDHTNTRERRKFFVPLSRENVFGANTSFPRRGFVFPRIPKLCSRCSFRMGLRKYRSPGALCTLRTVTEPALLSSRQRIKPYFSSVPFRLKIPCFRCIPWF